MGAIYQGLAEEVLRTRTLGKQKGKVQLVFTSPPFPLSRKKKYGNHTGQLYIDWLADLAPLLHEYLTEDGSIVIEIGNSWEAGMPVMSTLAIKALLAFQELGNYHLCQEFVAYNPARLPSPAQWVTVERIRVKDAFTKLWWLSPTPRPKANNRHVLKGYSKSMQELLIRGKYNSGRRPSEHQIGKESFLKNNGGAIPPNVLSVSNTRSSDPYQRYCKEHGIEMHPARMPPEVIEFFINFLTEPGDLVLDPFAGSNTTGYTAERLGRRWISIEPQTDYIRGSAGWFECDGQRNLFKA